MSKDPSRLPPLDLLVSFEAVARLGSITRAAAERFITQSAMSRQLQALEDDLGTALFKRQHRALAMTDAGRQLLATCTPLLAQLRETLAAIRAPHTREVLSLTTTPAFASLWLIPRLAGFTRDHPGVDVRIDAGFEKRDLKRDGFDLAVRYGPADSATGLRLFSEAVVPVCSPSWIKHAAQPLSKPGDLARHTLLQISAGAPGGMPIEWETWTQSQGLPAVQPASTLTFSNYGEAIAAALAGQGVALGRRPLIDELLRQRKLVVPFGQDTATERAYFLVTLGASARPAAKAMADWLVGQARGST